MFDQMSKLTMETNMGHGPSTPFTIEPFGSTGAGKREVTSLYSVESEIDAGETSKVFRARATIASHRGDSPQKATSYLRPPQLHSRLHLLARRAIHPLAIQVAIKRLRQTTPDKQFLAEYKSLKQINTINHPNVVETLAAFGYTHDNVPYFNFVSPLAMGNLKRLFRGQYDGDSALQSRVRVSLWDQFKGLASAVAYLHHSLQTAHRDIKPSNILLYNNEEAPEGENILLKLTDFGLSVDLSRANAREPGSAPSAWTYDSPEIRQATASGSGSSAAAVTLPTSDQLLSNDIWKLGCVFTEMLAFLVGGGSPGVSQFREDITTTEEGIQSDFFNDTRFDDGSKVKEQVIKWLDRASAKDPRARQLRRLVGEMLAVGSARPTAVDVCSQLLKVSDMSLQITLSSDNLHDYGIVGQLTRITKPQTDFGNVQYYSDGVRMVRFIAGSRMKPPGLIDRVRLNMENWLGQPIDWDPLPPPATACKPDQTVVAWQVSSLTEAQ